MILTGAGFTKNFGGFLASEMWSKIFNAPQIRSYPNVKEALLKQFDFDYEALHYQILHNEAFSADEGDAFLGALNTAYEQLDIQIRDWEQNNSNPYSLDKYGLADFLKKIAGDQQLFFFSLNQDLLMERIFEYKSPAAPGFDKHFYRKGTVLNQNAFVPLSADVTKISIFDDLKKCGATAYIKLHGSYGWIEAENTNGYVVGLNKEEQIDGIPLLKAYFDLFVEKLSQDSQKLVVIGYSFRDHHINQILKDAIEKHNLRILIITPSSPAQIRDNMAQSNDVIWPNIAGYIQTDLSTMFPASQKETQAYKEFCTLYDSL